MAMAPGISPGVEMILYCVSRNQYSTCFILTEHGLKVMIRHLLNTVFHFGKWLKLDV